LETPISCAASSFGIRTSSSSWMRGRGTWPGGRPALRFLEVVDLLCTSGPSIWEGLDVARSAQEPLHKRCGLIGAPARSYGEDARYGFLVLYFEQHTHSAPKVTAALRPLRTLFRTPRALLQPPLCTPFHRYDIARASVRNCFASPLGRLALRVLE